MENFNQKIALFSARAPPSKLVILAPKALSEKFDVVQRKLNETLWKNLAIIIEGVGVAPLGTQLDP